MRKIIIFLVVIGLGGLAYTASPKTICDRSLGYRLGTFDDRFGITKEQFAKAVADAEAVWEKPTGKNLFEQKDGGLFALNLVYDERQSYATQQQELSSQIETSRTNYSEKTKQYNTLVNQYQKDIKEYNDQVAYWNQRGGAPKEEFNRLEAKRQELNRLASQISALANQLNKMARDLNITVDSYNANAGVVFDQGQYTGDGITVYQFDNYSDLVLIIAHELGHALHLEHVEDPRAVMHYLKKDQDVKDVALAQDDIKALENECKKSLLLDSLTWKEWAVRARTVVLKMIR